jgi:hypothetical protein
VVGLIRWAQRLRVFIVFVELALSAFLSLIFSYFLLGVLVLFAPAVN